LTTGASRDSLDAAPVIAALDVCYRPTIDEEGLPRPERARQPPRLAAAAAACVLFQRWNDPAEASHRVILVDEVAPYEPGAFYRRELPCLLSALGAVGGPVDTVVVDGYVWLSAERRPGLGAHLFEALGGRTPVVGVAKTSFARSTFAEPVLRGRGARPLYVTAAGVDAPTAARWVREMAGPYRLPSLLQRADRLCRDALR
jgi:deoxyribonuclease V